MDPREIYPLSLPDPGFGSARDVRIRHRNDDSKKKTRSMTSRYVFPLSHFFSTLRSERVRILRPPNAPLRSASECPPSRPDLENVPFFFLCRALVDPRNLKARGGVDLWERVSGGIDIDPSSYVNGRNVGFRSKRETLPIARARSLDLERLACHETHVTLGHEGRLRARTTSNRLGCGVATGFQVRRIFQGVGSFERFA